jgi:hypothetical protein
VDQIVGGGTKKKIHLRRDILIVVVVLIAGASFFIGWYAGQHKKTNSPASDTSGWSTYKNQENGFQLQYPTDWQFPNFTKTEANGATHYALGFLKASSGTLQYTITLTMDKSGQHAVTSSIVKTILKEKKSSLAASDSTSYATIASIPQQKVSSLSETQIVNLEKTGVTAATLTYAIIGGKSNCPQNKIDTSNTGTCIEQSDYDTVNKVLKSIKAL